MLKDCIQGLVNLVAVGPETTGTLSPMLCSLLMHTQTTKRCLAHQEIRGDSSAYRAAALLRCI